MKKKNIKYVLGLVLSSLVIMAAMVTFTGKIVDATSATTYTRTTNSDNKVIRCQDGYLPEATYDRINLVEPQDMVIDTVIEGGQEVEYGYIINQGSATSGIAPFITKINLDNVATSVEKIELKGNIPYIASPSGLWIQTTTVNGITRKELYIADGSATYTEKFTVDDQEREWMFDDYTYTYNGLIYRIQFNSDGTDLLLNECDIIHEPIQQVSKKDYYQYELIPSNETDGRIIVPTSTNFKGDVKKTDKDDEVLYKLVVKKEYEDDYEERIVPVGQQIMKAASFGQTTKFNPTKVAVDSSGNIFVASKGTSAGMIQMSYYGEFVSFFVVNTVKYDFLYQFIKNYGTAEQLSKLTAATPQSFFNVFVDSQDLVYSVTPNNSVVFDRYSTGGQSILEHPIALVGLPSDVEKNVTDCYITKDGLMFLTLYSGIIYVFAPDGSLIFYFGSTSTSTATTSDIVGFFTSLGAITVDSSNRIWVIDTKGNYLQTFTPTDYANCIFNAIISFNNHDYETSRRAWEEVLQYDSLSVLGNNGLGKAYYYDLDFNNSLKYFATSKNRSLYSNVFWELRNDFLQANLTTIFIILIAVILVAVGLKFLFSKNKKLKAYSEKKKASLKEKRWFKDLTVGFRLIVKPNDTFYEMKTHHRGSIFGATLYYVLAIIAFLLNTYCYALPFQVITPNTLNPSTVLAAEIAVIAIFVLCNYLVSAINDGEGTFVDIYKFTGYSLLPIIICLPISVGISYGLTLNEQVILTILKAVAFWGSGIILVIGILETHNYTFGQTVKNIILTIIFMILFLIICMVVFVMIDQIKTFIETVWKEVKLRAGWY